MSIRWRVSEREHPQKCHFLYFLEWLLQQFCTTVQTVMCSIQTFCIHLLLFRGLLLSYCIVLFGLSTTRLNKITTCLLIFFCIPISSCQQQQLDLMLTNGFPVHELARLSAGMWMNYPVCLWTEFSQVATCGLQSCKNRASSISWPEVLTSAPI